METKDNANFFIVLVKAWVEKDGKYLLARRADTELHMPGALSLPGGKLDQAVEKDILQKTLAREVMEETGIQISDKVQLIYNNCFQRVDGAYVVGLTFVCTYESGQPQALEDTTELLWLTIPELNQLTEIEDFLKNEIQILNTFLS